MFMLAVDLDQAFGQFAELRDGRRAAVDPCTRSAVGAQGATQLAILALIEFGLAQPRQRGGRIAQVEQGNQLGALGAMAHHAAIGAQAGQEVEGVDQQRLAGAGFAGNNGQARAEFEFGRRDHGEILDGQVSQHRDSVRDWPC